MECSLKNLSKLIKTNLFKGTIILTSSMFLIRIIGFLFRIFLIGHIGEEGLGLFQLILPVQVIGFSLCIAGFETAIAKMVSEQKDDYSKIIIFKKLIYLSIITSIVFAMLIFVFSDYIAYRFLLEPRCEKMIKYLSIVFPFAVVHSCICSFYIAKKIPSLSAISTLVEQIVRVLMIFILIFILKKCHYTINPVVVVYGSIAGEISAAVFCYVKFYKDYSKILLQISKRKLNFDASIPDKKEIVSYVVPLTSNKLMLSVLQSIQSIMIPLQLTKYGVTNTEALSVYGIVLGLILPLICFPGSLINSLGKLLLPKISFLHANKKNEEIKKYISSIIASCFIYGVLCFVFFYLCSNLICHILFKNNYGIYIRLLSFSCPFIFLSVILINILNGLGKTKTAFIHSVFSTLIQLGSIIYLVPVIGITGFIIGITLSYVLVTILNYASIVKALM